MVADIAERKGMSLYRVAKDSGLTPNAIYKWQRDGIGRAQLQAVASVAKTLGCSIEELAGICLADRRVNG